MTDEVKRCIEIIRYCGNSKDGSACPKCPFNLLDNEKDPCVNQLFRKSADLIESLSTELEQVKRERDAAVADLRGVCRTVSVCFCCKSRDEEYVSNDCMDCINGCNWQWRGVKEENEC